MATLSEGGGREALRIGFRQRADDPDQARAEMTRLVAEAGGRQSGW